MPPRFGVSRLPMGSTAGGAMSLGKELPGFMQPEPAPTYSAPQPQPQYQSQPQQRMGTVTRRFTRRIYPIRSGQMPQLRSLQPEDIQETRQFPIQPQQPFIQPQPIVQPQVQPQPQLQPQPQPMQPEPQSLFGDMRYRLRPQLASLSGNQVTGGGWRTY